MLKHFLAIGSGCVRNPVDRLILHAIGWLRRHPVALRLVKTSLSNTLFHRAARKAVLNSEFQSAVHREVAVAPPEDMARNSTEHWDRHVVLVESRELKGWLDWEFVEVEHIRPQLSGDKSVYYLQHFFQNHLPSMPVERALSLGCGGGNLERVLIKLAAAQGIDAFDASPESIRLAIELAENEGVGDRIRYQVADINHLKLERCTYDFVVAKMSLHHFANLDHLYEQIRNSLKPGGMFMFNEYVGPVRFQWTDLQLELANQILQTLPAKYRHSAFSGETLGRITRPTIDEMIRMDPSEAVNSEEIVPLLKHHFEIVEHREYGGTLLHLLLNHIMANFDLTDELQASVIKLIFLFEQTLVQQKVLSSDFCYVVARPLQSGPP